MGDVFWYFIYGVFAWTFLREFLQHCQGTSYTDLQSDVFLWEVLSSRQAFSKDDNDNRTTVDQLSLENPQSWQVGSLPSFAAGSTVWCSGVDNSSRKCDFKNICYHTEKDKFIFIVTPDSNLLGVNDTDLSSLVYLSGLTGKISANLVLDTVPADSKFLTSKRIFRINTPVVLLHRYQPNDAFHVLHTDLLPLFTLYDDVCSGNVSECSQKYAILITDGEIYREYDHLYEIFSSQKLIYKGDLRGDTIYCFNNAKAGLVKHFINHNFNRSENTFSNPNNDYAVFDKNPTFIRKFTTLLSTKLYNNSKYKCDSNNSPGLLIIDAYKNIDDQIYSLFSNYSIEHLENGKHIIHNLLCAFSSEKAVITFSPKGLFIFYTPFHTYATEISHVVRQFVAKHVFARIQQDIEWKDLLCSRHACDYTFIESVFDAQKNLSEIKDKDLKFMFKLASHELMEQNEQTSQFLLYVSEDWQYEREHYYFNYQLPIYPFPGGVNNLTCVRNNGTIRLYYEKPWNVDFIIGFQLEYLTGYSRSNGTNTLSHYFHSVMSSERGGWVDTFPEEKIGGAVTAVYRGYMLRVDKLYPRRYVGPEVHKKCPNFTDAELKDIIGKFPRIEPIPIAV